MLQNMQDIRDSLHAGRLNNDSVPTHSIDDEQDWDGEEESNDEDQGDADLALQNEMAALCTQGMTENHFDKNGTATHTSQQKGTNLKCTPHSTEKPKLDSVIKCKTNVPKEPKENATHNGRFVAEGSSLNCLLKSTFLMDAQETTTTSPFTNKLKRIKPTGSVESTIAFGMERELDSDQQSAFEILTATVVLSFFEDTIAIETDTTFGQNLEAEAVKLRQLARVSNLQDGPPRVFMTGPAGAGKSQTINSLMDHCQSFCRSLGHIFNNEVIRLSALTGTAATQIKGTTIHHECKLGKNQKITSKDTKAWSNTRPLLADEVSFASHNGILIPLSKNLGELTETRDTPHGSVPLAFIGDFWQLEPIDMDATHKSTDSFFWEKQLNLFVELHGKWRFKNCPTLQKAFDPHRKNGMTEEVRKMFNKRAVKTNNTQLPPLETIKIATHTNKTKEFCNNRIFNDHLSKHHSKEKGPIPESAIIVFADLSWTHNGKKSSETQRTTIHDKCTEATTHRSSSPSKRSDPMLKLFQGCEVMATENEDVAHGIANGTTATFSHLVLKENSKTFPVKVNGFCVNAVHAEDVDSVRLKWSEGNTFKGEFSISPRLFACKMNFKTRQENRNATATLRLDVKQLPLTLNHATTGHKLQGKTLESLLVAEFAPRRVTDWLCNVLSRVQSIDNLCLLEEIPQDAVDNVDERLTKMLQQLNKKTMPKDTNEISIVRQQLTQTIHNAHPKTETE